MTLTAHAILRDRFRRDAMVLEISIFAITAVLLLTALIDAAVFRALAIDSERARTALGVLAVTAAVLAFVQTIVDWKERGGEHRRAVSVLAPVKGRGRRLLFARVTDDSREVLEWMREADDVLATLPPIPDLKFAQLKALHARKVEVSKLLDVYPGVPLVILRAWLFWRDIGALLRRSGPPQ